MWMQRAQVLDQILIGRFADQQALGFISEQGRSEAKYDADHDRGQAIEERVARQLRQRQPDGGSDYSGHGRTILKQDDECRRVLRPANCLEPAE